MNYRPSRTVSIRPNDPWQFIELCSSNERTTLLNNCSPHGLDRHKENCFLDHPNLIQLRYHRVHFDVACRLVVTIPRDRVSYRSCNSPFEVAVCIESGCRDKYARLALELYSRRETLDTSQLELAERARF